jgi:hypothetical protein
MTLAQLQTILSSTKETGDGKAILILQLVSVSTNMLANQLFAAGANKIAVHAIADTMLEDAEIMLVAAKAAATAPSKPVV